MRFHLSASAAQDLKGKNLTLVSEGGTASARHWFAHWDDTEPQAGNYHEGTHPLYLGVLRRDRLIPNSSLNCPFLSTKRPAPSVAKNSASFRMRNFRK